MRPFIIGEKVGRRPSKAGHHESGDVWRLTTDVKNAILPSGCYPCFELLRQLLVFTESRYRPPRSFFIELLSGFPLLFSLPTCSFTIGMLSSDKIIYVTFFPSQEYFFLNYDYIAYILRSVYHKLILWFCIKFNKYKTQFQCANT